MISSPILSLIPLFTLIAKALVLQPQGNLQVTNGSNSVTTPPDASLAASTALSLPLNQTRLNEWDTDCDAQEYGNDLSVQSCLQAFMSMRITSTQHIYRDRADPIPSDRKLPSLIVAGALL